MQKRLIRQIPFGDNVRKILSIFGLTFFIFAIALPQADAAQKKRSVTKSSKSTLVAKSPRFTKTTFVGKSLRLSKSINPPKRKVSRTFVVARRTALSRAAVQPLRLSFGQMAGLHGATDTLDLKSSVALVIDQDTNEVLFSKNDQAVLPIASLTKLMTGLILQEAKLPMDQMITISQADVDTEKGSSSRLGVGTELSRGELLHLALMSSENRAAHALARSYPGGMPVFVSLMNAKARSIGMSDTIYVEPTGLSSKNQSSARDLAKLVNVAHGYPILRELSTSPDYQVAVGNRTLQFNNTNRLVKNPSWDIGLQKTGYISEAGRCLVMQTKIAGRKLIMVFLDSAGTLSRIADAERVRRWVESRPVGRSTSISIPLASAAGEKTVHFQ